MRKIPVWLLYMIVGLVGLVGLANLLIFFWIVPLVEFDGWVARLSPEYRDSLHLAMVLGRLDAISALLAILGFGLGLGAIFGFGYLRIKAEDVAREEVHNLLPNLVPPLVASYLGMMDMGLEAKESVGDEVAQHVDPEDG